MTDSVSLDVPSVEAGDQLVSEQKEPGSTLSYHARPTDMRPPSSMLLTCG
jgi:hypothetical protein